MLTSSALNASNSPVIWNIPNLYGTFHIPSIPFFCCAQRAHFLQNLQHMCDLVDRTVMIRRGRNLALLKRDETGGSDIVFKSRWSKAARQPPLPRMTLHFPTAQLICLPRRTCAKGTLDELDFELRPPQDQLAVFPPRGAGKFVDEMPRMRDDAVSS